MPDTTPDSKRDAAKDARAKDFSAAKGDKSSPKKRRKVNHACVYCRRSRNIGHLCHDEAREPAKRTRSEAEHSAADEEGSSTHDLASVQGMPRPVDVPDTPAQSILPDGTIALPPTVNPAASGLGSNSQQLMGYNDWLGGQQNQFQDMHSLHPSYMFNAPEVTNEYNLLGDFLSNSLLDDGAMFQNPDMQGVYSDPTLMNSMNNMGVPNGLAPPQLPPPAQSQAPQEDSIQRATSTVVNDKARETYYMTAADPSGSDPPEERMNKLLKAKYDAGLLKPFNYVKGYARLNQYMEKNMQQASRQKILRQLDKFRPKFRERMQSLTDIELILVEMWFERSLMEYDRVFASMAIPACCWRRTGEIFRGNNEMAQLIDVPIEVLRDGKLAIHEIIVEDQLVSYWEKFGAIAFDNTQKAMLTSCTLKSPNPNSTGDGIPCCFSFTIRRDNHNIPSLIVGNFLPTQRMHK
ncbi:hypothetical protein N7474_011156 [Penicillium riverlandense]|uniref:uncharacterized protein n=1 Tax=Penicillium riverlandense TaxID=1903569 RepID=UPI0025493DBC|nr:uncharacterized protein N7474_011156 [Penicillium riverlandense]KAJ5805269.1 hypothetical protein N7474_011156 [Penicillium riverlandense]